MTIINILSHAGRLAVVGFLCGWLALPCDADTRAPSVVTNLAQLNELSSEDISRVVAVQISGVVWWSSQAEGRILLQDETAVLQLELDPSCEMPDLGDRLILEGEGSVLKVQDILRLSSVPLVDNDGLHPMAEQTGRIHLTAGYHPVRVNWFNRRAEYSLDVYYEGPDLPRQRIPDNVLFRAQADPAGGTTNFVPGLEYLCRGGNWLDFIPHFSKPAALASGVANNFDLDVRIRDDDVALEFSGYIQVPEDGEYAFIIASDDGSRLFIGPPSLRVKKIGKGELPAPKPILPAGAVDREPEYQWSVVEGEVTSLQHLEGALEVDLKTAWGSVTLKVAEDSDCAYALLPGNRIRAVGVGRKIFTLDGQWFRCELYIPHWHDLEQRYITPRIWSEYPLTDISRLAPPASMESRAVHLQGQIVELDTGMGMVLQDETGWIILDGKVPPDLVGQSVDVLGRLSCEGSNCVLQCCIFRPLADSRASAETLPLLTTNEQIVQLSLEESSKGYPIKVRGVVTCLLDFGGAVLHDSSRGIYLSSWALGMPNRLRVGDYCEVEGVTTAFEFNPFIQARQILKLGKGRFPDPVQPTWDQLINGSMQCNYVELEGVVESVDDHTIMLLTRDGAIKVRLNPSGPVLPSDVAGARVRLRGCLLAEWEGESRRAVVGSIYLDQHRVTVVDPAPTDPFSTPLKHVGDLLQFDPKAGALQRVRVSGLLIYKGRQNYCLMDAEHGLRFVPVESVTAQTGDFVEVVGFADLNGASPLLREAMIRPLGQTGEYEPRLLDADNLLRDEYDATLVQIDGVLLGVSRRQDGTVLEMQAGLRRFLATVEGNADAGASPVPGSELRLTGVYVGHGGNRVLGRPIDAFELRLNSARDIRLLSRPPWWTLKRLLLVVGLLLGFLAAALVWINLLHRKVERRTLQLGEQIQKRERAEQQRKIEQERARLAHDLHDELGSGLTEVNLLSLLAASPETPADEKAGFTDEINTLLSRMVLSLDEIVWAENPKNDTIASLAGYFGAHAQRLLEMAAVNCGLDMAEDLPDHPLDPNIRRELFLVFKEAITNIINHAKATKAWLRISVEGDSLCVVLADDGCGMLPEGRKAGSDGLDNMRHRMRAIGGSCEIVSDPGTGTTVRLQAPILRAKP